MCVGILQAAGPVVTVKGDVATPAASVVEDDGDEGADEYGDEREDYVGVGSVEHGPADLAVVIVVIGHGGRCWLVRSTSVVM